MKKLTKQEALKLSDEWWSEHNDVMLLSLIRSNITIIGDVDYRLNIYLSEHPNIQIVEPLSLFNKAENLWQNLNAVVLLDGKVDMEFLKQVLIENKPSKDDK